MSRRSEVTGPSYVYSERPPGFIFHLRRRSDSVLHCEGLPLPKLAERYGTPLYVYSSTAIRRRILAPPLNFCSLRACAKVTRG